MLPEREAVYDGKHSSKHGGNGEQVGRRCGGVGGACTRWAGEGRQPVAEQRSEIAKRAAAARWSNDLSEVVVDPGLAAEHRRHRDRVLRPRRRHPRPDPGGVPGGAGTPPEGERAPGGGGPPCPPSCKARPSRRPSPTKCAIAPSPSPSGLRTAGAPAATTPSSCPMCADLPAGAGQRGAAEQPVHVAKQAEILVRGLARVGIIALVDEATGYQELRTGMLCAHPRDVASTRSCRLGAEFPPDFYREMFRLRGLDYSPESVKRPQYSSHLTNNVVYQRLAPGVLDELKKVTPGTEKGNLRHKYFQRLTGNVGYPSSESTWDPSRR